MNNWYRGAGYIYDILISGAGIPWTIRSCLQLRALRGKLLPSSAADSDSLARVYMASRICILLKNLLWQRVMCGKDWCRCRKCEIQAAGRKCWNRGLKCSDCGERAHASSAAADAKRKTILAKRKALIEARAKADYEASDAWDAMVAEHRKRLEGQ